MYSSGHRRSRGEGDPYYWDSTVEKSQFLGRGDTPRATSLRCHRLSVQGTSVRRYVGTDTPRTPRPVTNCKDLRGPGGRHRNTPQWTPTFPRRWRVDSQSRAPSWRDLEGPSVDRSTDFYQIVPVVFCSTSRPPPKRKVNPDLTLVGLNKTTVDRTREIPTPQLTPSLPTLGTHSPACTRHRSCNPLSLLPTARRTEPLSTRDSGRDSPTWSRLPPPSCTTILVPEEGRRETGPTPLSTLPLPPTLSLVPCRSFLSSPTVTLGPGHQSYGPPVPPPVVRDVSKVPGRSSVFPGSISSSSRSDDPSPGVRPLSDPESGP